MSGGGGVGCGSGGTLGTGAGGSVVVGVGGGSTSWFWSTNAAGNATARTIEPIRIVRRTNFAANAYFSICSSVGKTMRLVAAATSTCSFLFSSSRLRFSRTVFQKAMRAEIAMAVGTVNPPGLEFCEPPLHEAGSASTGVGASLGSQGHRPRNLLGRMPPTASRRMLEQAPHVSFRRGLTEQGG